MPTKDRIDSAVLRALAETGRDAAPLDAKVEMLRGLRAQSAETNTALDRCLLEIVERSRNDALELLDAHQLLGQTLEQILAPPWYLATFRNLIPGDPVRHALVVHNGVARVVGLAESVDPASLEAGETVYLAHQLNIITGKAEGVSRGGETATYERPADDGRCVLRCRDEEIVADMSAALRDVPLQRGDLLRWERSAWMAFEKLNRRPGQHHFIEAPPAIGRDRVGGQDDNLNLLLSVLTATLIDPAAAALYELGARNSILMIGPPGCGKTLMARIAAAEITRLSGRTCRFAVVKPAEWESPWVGEAEQNIRNCFKALRDAAADDFAVLFLDEVECIGRIRGNAVGYHSDKSLAALLAELDGFEGRERVAVIAASNRKDLMDPALLARLSDFEIRVQRPNMEAARAIFAIHLAESLPYSPNGAAAPQTRRELIDCAVSRWYAPNADNHICTLRFRDGKERQIAARELASGRTFEQICRAARWNAFKRHAAGGTPGLCTDDVDDAISDAFDRLASTLSPGNLRAHLDDLPQDVDIVAVHPAARRVARPHQFLTPPFPSAGRGARGDRSIQ